MKINGVIVLLCTALVSGQQCPTWFVREGDNKCVCSNQINTLVHCSTATNKTKIIENYCLTYNNDTEHFGACPYNTKSRLFTFTEVPSDVSKLDQEMCGPLNRTGLLCSHCQSGLGPAVFSYYRECKECLPQPYGWLLYFVRLVVPLTLLCVLVIVFRINIAHPLLNSLVTLAHIASTVLNNNSPFFITGYFFNYSFVKFLADILGLFNLDFFAFLIPSICVSENMNTPTVIALDYLAAFYPILFTLAAYWLITLHDRGCKIVVNCWRPFHHCLARCRSSWELKGSVVNAFTTFFILSYSKFCSVSLNLLKPVPLYDKHGNVTYTLFFAADFNVKEYIPLAILGSMITIFMVIFPAIFLLLYQNRFFQKCLCLFKIKCFLIHELANITQRYFKNGTSSGTKDLRWFAGVYLLLRIIFIGSSSQRNHTFVYQIVSILLLVLILCARPYKKDRYNYLDAFIIAAVLTGFVFYINQLAFKSHVDFLKTFAIGTILMFFPLFLSWGIYSALCNNSSRCYVWKFSSRYNRLNTNNEPPLPHRLSDPNEYQQLIPSA